jgi:hypothetical protein
MPIFTDEIYFPHLLIWDYETLAHSLENQIEKHLNLNENLTSVFRDTIALAITLDSSCILTYQRSQEKEENLPPKICLALEQWEIPCSALALKLIDCLLQENQQKNLNDLQSELLLAVWEGQSYQMLADRLNYEVDYIKQIAARLWKQIAQIVGEDVSKGNIQSVLRRYQQTHEFSVSS